MIVFMKKLGFLFLIISIFLTPLLSFGQQNEGELVVNKQDILKAKVIEIIHEESGELLDTGIRQDIQDLKVEILEGDNKGDIVDVHNDYLKLKKNEVFYLMESFRGEDMDAFYAVHDKYRLPQILFFVLLFIVSVFVFGGIQGVRGLVSLIGSILLIVFVLVPGILNGYSPVVITIGVSSLIIILGSYLTHGFNRTTTSAVVGMIFTVFLTGALAYIAVHITNLTGFDSEEAVYLNWNTNGSIDFIGLLFGGIMIGLLGVLYDVAIGQAVSVEELHKAGVIDRKVVFKRVTRIGREHIGALVNTLAIAYVGASLPLLLLFFSNGNTSPLEALNREIFAAEIIRTMIGSIGLVLSVPITTFVSTVMLVKKEKEG